MHAKLKRINQTWTELENKYCMHLAKQKVDKVHSKMHNLMIFSVFLQGGYPNEGFSNGRLFFHIPIYIYVCPSVFFSLSACPLVSLSICLVCIRFPDRSYATYALFWFAQLFLICNLKSQLIKIRRLRQKMFKLQTHYNKHSLLTVINYYEQTIINEVLFPLKIEDSFEIWTEYRRLFSSCESQDLLWMVPVWFVLKCVSLKIILSTKLITK